MTHDPRVLFEVFDHIGTIVLRWSSDVSCIEASFRAMEQAVLDSVSRLKVASRGCASAASEAKDDAVHSEQKAQAARLMCDGVRSQAYASRGSGESTKSRCSNSLSAWGSALLRAEQGLSKAEANLQSALQRQARAVDDRANAASELFNARASLRSCLASRDNRSCSLESRRVERAEFRLEACERELMAANELVDEAQREVARWRALVTACRGGVTEAKKLEAMAEENLRLAEEGCRIAAACYEEADDVAGDAGRLIDRSHIIGAKSQESVMKSHGMGSSVEYMGMSVIRVSELAAAQRDLYIQSRSLLQGLEDKLRHFNAPGGGI